MQIPRDLEFVNITIEAKANETIDHASLENLEKTASTGEAAQLEHERDRIDGSSVSLRDSAWALQNAEDAMLVRHFIEKVSQFFDFCDPGRQFARTVPQLARSSSTLASAIMSCSARHLNRTTGFDAHVADIHYQRCLEQLIPAIARDVDDETLLIATVVLRFMEELDVPMTGRDSHDHLFGTQAILRALHESPMEFHARSDLLQAAHWAALRQDMYVALTAQRPMQLRNIGITSALQHDRQLQPGQGRDNDAQWANHAVLQCSDVAHYVFGNEPRTIDRCHQLKQSLEAWQRNKPASFEPYFVRDDPEAGVSQILLLADWHVMGHMYNLLATLLLLACESSLACQTVDRIEDRPERTVANKALQSTLQRMAGIAVSNVKTVSAMLVVSMAVAKCGDCVVDRVAQQALHRILVATERCHGWPTTAVQRQLQTSWQ